MRLRLGGQSKQRQLCADGGRVLTPAPGYCGCSHRSGSPGTRWTESRRTLGRRARSASTPEWRCRASGCCAWWLVGVADCGERDQLVLVEGARRNNVIGLYVFPHSEQIETRHCQKVHKIIRTQYVVVGRFAVFVSAVGQRCRSEN